MMKFRSNVIFCDDQRSKYAGSLTTGIQSRESIACSWEAYVSLKLIRKECVGGIEWMDPALSTYLS
jgi:hypothetical protein